MQTYLRKYLALHDALDKLATDCIVLNSQIVDITERVMKAKSALQKLYDEEAAHGQDVQANQS